MDLYIPISTKKEDSNKLKQFEIFGKILVKLIFDERTCQIPLASSIFKYLQVLFV